MGAILGFRRYRTNVLLWQIRKIDEDLQILIIFDILRQISLKCDDYDKTMKGGHIMDNNEKFNQMLNACQNPRRVYGALLSLAGKPCVQHTHDVAEKRQILVGELLPLLDESQGDEQLR